jgi:hypothetical protein
VSYIDEIRPFMAAVPARSGLVLLALWARANPAQAEPVVWPSRETMAEDTGMTDRSVRRALNDLESIGAITRLGGTRIRLTRRTAVTKPDSGDRTLVTKADSRDRSPVSALDNGDQKADSRDQAWSPVSPKRSKNTHEHSNIERALAPRISDQEKPRAVRPRGADDEAQPWRAVLTEASMMTPPGARAVRPGGKRPPDGIVDVIDRLGVRGTVDVLSQYAAYCRRHPEQAKWWSWGMFTAKRWDVVERMAAEMEPQVKHETEAQRYMREQGWAKKC